MELPKIGTASNLPHISQSIQHFSIDNTFLSPYHLSQLITLSSVSNSVPCQPLFSHYLSLCPNFGEFQFKWRVKKPIVSHQPFPSIICLPIKPRIWYNGKELRLVTFAGDLRSNLEWCFTENITAYLFPQIMKMVPARKLVKMNTDMIRVAM